MEKQNVASRTRTYALKEDLIVEDSNQTP